MATHELTTKHRTFNLVVDEHPDRVQATLTSTRRGSFGDEDQAFAWLREKLARYDDDARPLAINYQGGSDGH